MARATDTSTPIRQGQRAYRRRHVQPLAPVPVRAEEPAQPQTPVPGRLHIPVVRGDRLRGVAIGVLCVLAGICAGLSAAGDALAIAGRPVLGLSPLRVELVMVVGPLFGLVPLAALCLMASSDRELTGPTLRGLGLWMLAGVVTLAWVGLVPLLS